MDGHICSSFEISRTHENESAEVINYMKKILSETNVLSMNADEFKYTVEEEALAIRKYSETPNRLMLSARVNNKLVGMLTYDGGSRLRTKHTGVVGVSVSKEYWGNNIATKLFAELFDWAKSNGFTKKINLAVREDNQRAIELYARLGFKITGKETMSQLTDGVYYSSINMGIEFLD